MSGAEPSDDRTARLPETDPTRRIEPDPTQLSQPPAPQEATRLDNDEQPTQAMLGEPTRVDPEPADGGRAADATAVLPQHQAAPVLPPPVLAPPNPSTRTGTYQLARWAHVLVALIAWLALGLQVWAAATAQPTSAGVAEALLQALALFPVWSSIVVALIASGLAINPIRNNAGFPTSRLTSLVMATMSALLYFVVLSPSFQRQGEQALAEVMLSIVVPALVLLVYGFFGPRPRLEYRNIVPALVIPVVWMGYTLVHGVVTQWYPYDFVNVDTSSYGRVAANLVTFLLISAVLAAVFVVIDKRLPWAPRR
ncbi:MAG: Pr6Pr family membrane protein [Actinomycetia bacterium]|nr:Pr6Pr family membrane protein [Actinomycetes bacterium]